VSGQVYSECFLQIATSDVWFSYTVPPGQRAVIRDIQSTDLAGGGWTLAITARGTYLVNRTLQAQEHFSLDCRVVVYGGEAIAVRHYGGSGHTLVGGYLFRDTLRRSGPPPHEESDEHPTMPSLSPR